MKIKLFLDGANQKDIRAAVESGLAQGFTTNPSLMRKSGVTDYEAFARDVLKDIKGLPISFEVFADDFPTIIKQAHKIAAFGDNVYVKIPVMNTKGESAGPTIKELSEAGLKLNVTAIFTIEQVREVVDALAAQTPAVISVFAGRVADTGVDPIPLMRESVSLAKKKPKAEVLWASPREALNIYQAEELGCHIITAPQDLLSKLPLKGRDLLGYSKEAVQIFYDDAQKSGFKL